MPVVVWGTLEKSQIDNETIEEAVARLIQSHEDDPNSHVEIGESLYSHKAAAIIDHLIASVVADKIKDLAVTTIKLAASAVTDEKVSDVGGTKITGEVPVAHTEAKATDPNADETAAHKAADTDKVQGEVIIVGGYIAADFMTATNIVAGILTGRTVRTAATGNYRVEMRRVGDADANHVKWYAADNSALAYIYGSSGGNLTLYAKNELQLVSGYSDIVSQDKIRPFQNNTLDLGATSYYWNNLYLNYLRFNTSYGYLYFGATLLQSYYSYATSFATRIRLKNLGSDPTTNKYEGQIFMNTWDDRARLYDGADFRDICYYDERNAASPIPTFVSGLEQLKKIKAPVVLVEKGLCFDTQAFPEEFKVKLGPKKEEHIDLKAVAGMNIQALKELDKRVEDLEQKNV